MKYTYIKQIHSTLLLQHYLISVLPTLMSITISTSNNYIDIEFPTTLTIADKIILDNLIISYTNPQPLIPYIPILINSIFIQNNQTEWTRVVEWVDNGSRILSNVSVNSRLQPNNDNTDPDFKYFLRLFDKTHSVILGSGEYTNIENVINTIQISNFTINTNSLIELHVKKNTPGVVTDILSIVANYLPSNG